MAKIIYYNNLDYDLLPTAKKRRSTASAVSTASTDQEPAYIYIDSDGDDDITSTSNSNNNFVTTNIKHTEGVKENVLPSSLSSNISSASTVCYDYPNSLYPSTPARSSKPPPSHTTVAPKLSAPTSTFTSASSYSPPSPQEYQQYQRESKPTRKAATKGTNSKSSAYRQNDYRQDDCEVEVEYACRTYNQPPDNKLLIDTLKKYFKFDQFRENQLEAVNATCMGKDTLILMPTGGGKSICYQLPAIISRGITIVVSPLKSLIADQVARMRSLNVKTSALYGETADDEAEYILHDLRQSAPSHKLLYVTPEKIGSSNHMMSLFESLYKRSQLARFVIDEAHCVSMWGSDFRPDYRKLGKLRDLFPSVPIMALTATAPPKVRDDILDQLRMVKANSAIFIQSFNRPNLKFEVRTKTKGCLKDICNMIRANFAKQCGIIYCLSRADCTKVSEELREFGITSAPYHAGLSDDARKRVFSAWSSGRFQVVCATIAFGMGIDKSDVRFVIHYSMPKSVEGYYQEAGRAGRDGKFASCILFFSGSDLYRMRSMLSKTGFGRKAEDKNRDVGNLQHMIDYVDNKNECRRTILLRYLGEDFNSEECIRHIGTACDNCLSRFR